MPSQHTPATTLATDADTATPTENAQQLDRDAITATVWTTSQPFSDPEDNTTDIADTVGERPTDQDIAADLPADQAAETGHITDTQGDTEAPHHIPSTLSPLHKTS